MVLTLLDQRLIMLLTSHASLLTVFNSVLKSQINAPERVSLALPTNELHCYYDSKLLREVATFPAGLLLTLAIPRNSSQTAFQVYKPVTMLMPQPEPNKAIQWSEVQPLAMLGVSMKSTALRKEQLDNWLELARFL